MGLMTRVWQHFEQRISPILMESDDTAALPTFIATGNMFNDVADSLLTSCDNIIPTEVKMFIE